MGRYELARPTLRKRIINRVIGVDVAERMKNWQLAKRIRNLAFSAVAFFFAGSYVLVTAVDPYGGALSSAYAFEFENTADSQTYGLLRSRKSAFPEMVGKLSPVMRRPPFTWPMPKPRLPEP